MIHIHIRCGWGQVKGCTRSIEDHYYVACGEYNSLCVGNKFRVSLMYI